MLKPSGRKGRVKDNPRKQRPGSVIAVRTFHFLLCLPVDFNSQRSQIYETAINSLVGYYCMILCRLEFNTKFKIISVIMELLNCQSKVSARKVLPRQT